MIRFRSRVKILCSAVVVLVVLFLVTDLCSWIGLCGEDAWDRKPEKLAIRGGRYPRLLPKKHRYEPSSREFAEAVKWDTGHVMADLHAQELEAQKHATQEQQIHSAQTHTPQIHIAQEQSAHDSDMRRHDVEKPQEQSAQFEEAHKENTQGKEEEQWKVHSGKTHEQRNKHRRRRSHGNRRKHKDDVMGQRRDVVGVGDVLKNDAVNANSQNYVTKRNDVKNVYDANDNEGDVIDMFKDVRDPDDVDTRNVQIYDVTKKMTEQFKCVNIHVVPVTPICLFDPKDDVFVSGTLTRGDVWEEHIVRKFQKSLSLHPGICVIDIGANLGQYSLIAANMGHTVVAVEPYLPSLKRFHKAIQKGNFGSKIQVLQNAVADNRGVVNMKANIDNQGDARAHPLDYNQCLGGSCQPVKAIHLDDLIPFIHSSQCVLKMDIQGYEHRAFQHGSLLLYKINIPYIFMEWSIMRDFYITEAHRSEDKTLVNSMVDLLVKKGYTVYSLVSGKKLNTKYWHGWAEDVLWVLKTAKPEVIEAAMPYRVVADKG